MQRYVKPFKIGRMKRDILNVLLRKSQIVELTSDDKPYSHKEQNDDVGLGRQKYFENSPKKQDNKFLNPSDIQLDIEKNGELSSPQKMTMQASNIKGERDSTELTNPVLYVRGTRSDSFYLILSGKVMICTGNEGFMVEQGAFNYMGVDCLTNDNYVPDFSAKVIGKVKLLKITREDYRKSLSHINNITK